MRNRLSRAPSWTEVILGICLSMMIGAAAGCAFLVFKPVETVREIPKDAPSTTVYYIEGHANMGDRGEVEEKKADFIGGKSISLTEDEINALAGSLHPASDRPASPGGKPNASAPNFTLEPGRFNFRIHDGVVQIGVPVNISIYGMQSRVIVQATGSFAKSGNTVVFEPDTMYVGSCPLQRIPRASSFVLGRILQAAGIPEEVTSAWYKVTGASIDGTVLYLTVP